MTHLEFTCSDEKVVALLQASRLYDEGVKPVEWISVKEGFLKFLLMYWSTPIDMVADSKWLTLAYKGGFKTERFLFRTSPTGCRCQNRRRRNNREHFKINQAQKDAIRKETHNLPQVPCKAGRKARLWDCMCRMWMVEEGGREG